MANLQTSKVQLKYWVSLSNRERGKECKRTPNVEKLSCCRWIGRHTVSKYPNVSVRLHRRFVRGESLNAQRNQQCTVGQYHIDIVLCKPAITTNIGGPAIRSREKKYVVSSTGSSASSSEDIYRAGVSGISQTSCLFSSSFTPCCPAPEEDAKGITPCAVNTGRSCILLAGDIVPDPAS
jgi:hypothetical protein